MEPDHLPASWEPRANSSTEAGHPSSTTASIGGAYEEARRLHSDLGWFTVPVRLTFLEDGAKNLQPLVKWKADGFWDGDRDVGELERAWRDNEGAPGLAVFTGRRAGITALDPDSSDAEDLIRDKGVPRTASFRSRRGVKRVFRHPDRDLVDGHLSGVQGLELKTERLLVVPPTPGYAWLPASRPEEAGLASLPEWVLARMDGTDRRHPRVRIRSGDELPPHEAHNEMLRIIGKLARSLAPDELFETARALNGGRLPDQEVRALVESIVAKEGKPFISDGRPDIDASIGDLAEASAQAQKALEEANRPPRYFSHGGELVRIEHDDDARPFTRPLGLHHLKHHLARAAHYFRRTRDGKVDARPPQDVVQDLLASPERMWPTLRRIVSVPVFAADGTLCETAGYNPAAHAWYDPAGLVIANIAEVPDDLAVAEAVDLLCEVIADFPFVDDADRAHALAMMLQPFARDLIAGPTPLFLIEKPEPGTGATLLATVALYPALGRPAKTFTEATNEEEWRKRITSALREAPDAILVENLHGKLSTAALAAVLTTDEWGDRLLGVSQMVRLPVRCVWVATANNPRLSTEMIRRSVRIRMDSGQEQPWLREPTSFAHPDLRGWVDESRADLVEACLTVVRAWVVAGRPNGPAVLGMFEPWAKVMSGILQVAGIEGFLENTAEFYSSMAEDDQNLGEFVARWAKRYPVEEVGVANLIKMAEETLDLGKGSERSQSTVLGQILRENRDRRFGDLVIRRAKTYHGAARWKLEQP